jgi:hypothetical protein
VAASDRKADGKNHHRRGDGMMAGDKPSPDRQESLCCRADADERPSRPWTVNLPGRTVPFNLFKVTYEKLRWEHSVVPSYLSILATARNEAGYFSLKPTFMKPEKELALVTIQPRRSEIFTLPAKRTLDIRFLTAQYVGQLLFSPTIEGNGTFRSQKS